MVYFSLVVNKDKTLHSNYRRFEEFIVGMEIQYPKKIYYYSKTRTNTYSKLHTEKEELMKEEYTTIVLYLLKSI